MQNRTILVAIVTMFAILAGGALGFVMIEGYAWPEGIYMAVITVTTVGFGEVRPLSPAGRVFTTIYTLSSFVGVAVLFHFVARSMLDAVLSREWKERRMMKTIARMNSHYILCGYGRMGRAAAWPFEASGLDIVVIESDPLQCEKLRKANIPLIVGDSTQESTLRDAGIARARGLLALLDSDPHNLYIVLTARELNPDIHIIARVEDESSETRIMRAGADSVVSPFASAGCRVGQSMIESTRSGQGAPVPVPGERGASGPESTELAKATESGSLGRGDLEAVSGRPSRASRS